MWQTHGYMPPAVQLLDQLSALLNCYVTVNLTLRQEDAVSQAERAANATLANATADPDALGLLGFPTECWHSGVLWLFTCLFIAVSLATAVRPQQPRALAWRRSAERPALALPHPARSSLC